MRQNYEVELLTVRTMLVPAEFLEGQLLDEQQARKLLAANGMAAQAGETVVWSDTKQSVIAIMAVPCEVLKGCGESARYTTPLLRPFAPAAPTVQCYIKAGLLYLRVYNRKLRFAAVIPAVTEADIIYFIERLRREFPLREYELRLTGDYKKAHRKALQGYFKRISCE